MSILELKKLQNEIYILRLSLTLNCKYNLILCERHNCFRDYFYFKIEDDVLKYLVLYTFVQKFCLSFIVYCFQNMSKVQSNKNNCF